mgnify:FL=1
MLGVELADPGTRLPRPDLAERAVREAERLGLVLMRSGPEGAVLRLLPPLVISTPELDLGLDALEAALVAAGAADPAASTSTPSTTSSPPMPTGPSGGRARWSSAPSARPPAWSASTATAARWASPAWSPTGSRSRSSTTLSFLLPARQHALMRWCLEAGLRVVTPMTCMAMGRQRRPSDAWIPSVLY